MAQTNLHHITVLIVDDHSVVRQGLRTFLDLHDDIQVVGEASGGAEAIELAERLAPDIVLMDLVMPGMDGIEATRQIRAHYPGTKVIALTSFLEDELVFPALDAGVSGYLMKDLTPPELAQAIRTVHQGKADLHPEVARKLLDEFQAQREVSPIPDLTQREVEVLALIAKGLTNREIAERLVITQKTVKAHVSSILGKLNLSDRTQAAIFAIKQGLFD
ncbi:MAG: response regulator transcription factor [Anaerolineaceae bacterium]|nr:response regulator transcription factor [Anaerolineaceae bacterium]